MLHVRDKALMFYRGVVIDQVGKYGDGKRKSDMGHRWELQKGNEAKPIIGQNKSKDRE